MDHTPHNSQVTAGRKIACSLQYALQLKGTPFKKTVHGGLEFPHYESYDLYFNNLLSIFETLTISPQYRISKLARLEKVTDSKKLKRSKAIKVTFPDFAILRSVSEQTLIEHDASGWIFQRRHVLAVVEIKPLCDDVHPDYSEEEVSTVLEPALSAGDKQAKVQVKYVFASESDQEFVFAITGVGPYWRYTIFERSKTSPLQGDDEEFYIKNALLEENPFVSPLQKLGTRGSAEQFVGMVHSMKRKFGVVNGDW